MLENKRDGKAFADLAGFAKVMNLSCVANFTIFLAIAANLTISS